MHNWEKKVKEKEEEGQQEEVTREKLFALLSVKSLNFIWIHTFNNLYLN